MIINALPHYIIFFIEELFVDYDVRNGILVYILPMMYNVYLKKNISESADVMMNIHVYIG
jgi:hypothetical protein